MTARCPLCGRKVEIGETITPHLSRLGMHCGASGKTVAEAVKDAKKNLCGSKAR